MPKQTLAFWARHSTAQHFDQMPEVAHSKPIKKVHMRDKHTTSEHD